jgi:hypothetical protein
MVGKSPAWRQLAAELGLNCKETRGPSRLRRRKIGLEIALEQQAVEQSAPVVDRVRREKIIESAHRRLSREVAEATVEKLMRGEMTDEGAEETIEIAASSQ